MKLRTWAILIALTSLIAASTAWAGRIGIGCTSSVQNDKILGYCYDVVIDGYPPAPHEEIIFGALLSAYGNPMMGGYKTLLDSAVLEVNVGYNWKACRYADYDNCVLGEVLASGWTTAW